VSDWQTTEQHGMRGLFIIMESAWHTLAPQKLCARWFTEATLAKS